MLQRITDNVFRIHNKGINTCNAYYIKDKRILVDTGSPSAMGALKRSLPVAPEDVSMVLLTHLHYDHIGSFQIFRDVPFFTSRRSVELLHDRPEEAILDIETVKTVYEHGFSPEVFPESRLKDMGFTIYDTPGHAEGSVCILFEDEDEKILFSGDLFFDPSMDTVGRTDLPTSDEAALKVSLRKMSAVRYDILCPGHGETSKKR